MKIAHLSSVHRRDDTRILHRQCRSLAEAGHQVVLVVADGRGPGEMHGVSIVDAGRSRHRVARMLSASRRVVRMALDIDADLYHLHDPELLPSALGLKRHGRTVVFDAHEDDPLHILGKHYLHPWVRRPLARAVDAIERWACPRLDAVVAATTSIGARFAPINPRTVVVNNYPRLGELGTADRLRSDRAPLVAYIGSITRVRGILELVDAMPRCRSDARLALGGAFSPPALRRECETRPGWARVDALGHLDRDGVRTTLRRCSAGMVLFQPAPNHLEAQPNKLFEYMSAGLPVVASDFPAWRRIVEGCGCGLLVDPLDPAAIAAAIDRLHGDPEEAERMGRRGREAVERRYNWSAEEATLLGLYESLASADRRRP